MRLLSDMLGDLPIAANVEGSTAVPITRITTDSREAGPGSLFIAIRGTKVDGHDHVGEALARGVSAVVTDHASDVAVPMNIANISVENTREALSYFAAVFYGMQPNCIVAVTGTDGKTSTAEFARQLFELQGKASASIGTLGVKCSDAALAETLRSTHTSPDPMLLHKLLQELKQGGIEHVAIEASSHGLDQHRIDAVNIDAAAVTTITRDHLDYHGTEADYVAAKLRLFSELLPKGKRAVLNADDAHYAAFRAAAEKAGNAIVTYGYAGEDIRILDVVANAQGLSAKLRVGGEDVSLVLPHYGEFQLMNMCAAVGLTAGDASLASVMTQCSKLKGVPGRMELVARHPNGAVLFIDYAHTPGALEKLLQVARRHVKGRLHLVFGCGGDRDAGKRPLMGAVAEALADVVIVTDDNPRSETPAAIRAEIMEACPKAREIGDRAEAIRTAMTELQKDDALIVAGKGHETTQTIGTQVLHFNDAEAIREAVARL